MPRRGFTLSLQPEFIDPTGQSGVADINRFGGFNECVAVVDNQFCSFELKFSSEMFSYLITCRIVEVSISPPIRWPVSACHYNSR